MNLAVGECAKNTIVTSTIRVVNLTVLRPKGERRGENQQEGEQAGHDRLCDPGKTGVFLFQSQLIRNETDPAALASLIFVPHISR